MKFQKSAKALSVCSAKMPCSVQASLRLSASAAARLPTFSMTGNSGPCSVQAEEMFVSIVLQLRSISCNSGLGMTISELVERGTGRRLPSSSWRQGRRAGTER